MHNIGHVGAKWNITTNNVLNESYVECGTLRVCDILILKALNRPSDFHVAYLRKKACRNAMFAKL